MDITPQYVLEVIVAYFIGTSPILAFAIVSIIAKEISFRLDAEKPKNDELIVGADGELELAPAPTLKHLPVSVQSEEPRIVGNVNHEVKELPDAHEGEAADCA